MAKPETTQPSIPERLSAMLNKSLYVAMRETKNAKRMGELLHDHLDWAVAAERKGQLFASGPFAVEEGAAPGSAGGMTILRAGSLAEAEAILAEDPFIREKAVSVTIRKWTVMEGGLTVTVRFSDQSAHLL